MLWRVMPSDHLFFLRKLFQACSNVVHNFSYSFSWLAQLKCKHFAHLIVCEQVFSVQCGISKLSLLICVSDLLTDKDM